mmetsp:Transcript_34504/g.42195  ORF Transcript_34504/g.42195 Transcript_34504/m.42195 type:complete len:233 (+) Transcript_34504:67-765(+)
MPVLQILNTHAPLNTTLINSKTSFSRPDCTKLTHEPLRNTSINMQSVKSFPEHLMDMLSNEKKIVASGSVTWAPHGKAFIITKPSKFAKQVLPQFFNKRIKTFRAFLQELKDWGFMCIKSGPEKGSFYHALFQRDHQNLCLKIVKRKSQFDMASLKNGTVTDRKSVRSQTISHDIYLQEKLLLLADAASHMSLTSNRESMDDTLTKRLLVKSRNIETLKRVRYLNKKTASSA